MSSRTLRYPKSPSLRQRVARKTVSATNLISEPIGEQTAANDNLALVRKHSVDEDDLWNGHAGMASGSRGGNDGIDHNSCVLDGSGYVSSATTCRSDSLGLTRKNSIGSSACSPVSRSSSQSQAQLLRRIQSEGSAAGSDTSEQSSTTWVRTFSVIDKEIRGLSLCQLKGLVEDIVENPTPENLQRSKSRFEGMFAILEAAVKMSSYPIVVMTTDCRVVLTSPSIVNVLGYTSDELLMQNINMIMPHDIARRHDDIIQRYIDSVITGESNNKVSSVVDATRPVTCKAKDGSEVPVELTVKAIMAETEDQQPRRRDECLDDYQSGGEENDMSELPADKTALPDIGDKPSKKKTIDITPDVSSTKPPVSPTSILNSGDIEPPMNGKEQVEDDRNVGTRSSMRMPFLFVAQLKDVRAEVDLRNTVEESKTLQAMFPFPYIEASEDMTITKFNPAAAEAFGISAERAIGKNVMILMPETIKSARSGRLRTVLSTSHDSIARNFISKVRSVGANNVTSRIVGHKVLQTAVRINNNDTRSLLPEPFPIELEVKMQLSSSGVIKFQAFIRDCENFLNAKEAEDAILKQTFPEPVANSLIAGESVNGEMNLAVIFVDLVKFTALSRLISDEVAMQVLDDVFSRFTALREKRCKFMDPIKINYDEFMCVCGLNPDYASQNIADQAVRVAEAMHEAVKEYNATSDWDVDIRVGIDVGSCQVGIIGSSGLKTFDLIGQTTVRASRAEGTCDAGGIHLMDTAYNALSDTYKHKFIEVKTEFKNIGSVKTFKSIKNMSSARG